MLVTHNLWFNQTLWYPCIWRDSKNSWNMYMWYYPDWFEVPLYIYHFIYSSADRHLGCFCLLIKLLWTFMSACSRVCFSPCFRVFWNKYPRVKLLGHVVNFLLNFWGSAILSCTGTVSFYIPTSREKDSIFFYILVSGFPSLPCFWWQHC